MAPLAVGFPAFAAGSSVLAARERAGFFVASAGVSAASAAAASTSRFASASLSEETAASAASCRATRAATEASKRRRASFFCASLISSPYFNASGRAKPISTAYRKPSTISEIATFQPGTLGETALSTFCRPKTIHGQRPVSASNQPQVLAR